jgi:hypothetical protein
MVDKPAIHLAGKSARIMADKPAIHLAGKLKAWALNFFIDN